MGAKSSSLEGRRSVYSAVQWAKSLWSADLILDKVAQPLNSSSIGHEPLPRRGIRVRRIQHIEGLIWHSKVAEYAERTLCLLELLGQHEGVEQLGTFGMRRILENGAVRDPRHERSVLWK